jgi:hypothetical protein
MSKIPRENPLRLSKYTFKTMKARRIKTDLFLGCEPMGKRGHKEKVNEVEYSGRTLHSYMKIEE